MGRGRSGLKKSGGGNANTATQSPAAPPVFPNTDNGPFKGLTKAEENSYYAKQNLTAAQQAAFDLYTDPNTEPGSLYNFSQNMNYNHVNGLPMTAAQQNAWNEINGAMHNLGQNMELTRYDHAGTVDDMLRQLGVRGSAANMSLSNLKNALVGTSYTDDRILSTSVNDFQNAVNPSTFDTRQFKFTYKARAGAQGVMPGQGKTPMRHSRMSSGDDFGELLLGPKNNYKIIDVKYSGKKARAKGQPAWNLTKKQIEIVVEVD